MLISNAVPFASLKSPLTQLCSSFLPTGTTNKISKGKGNLIFYCTCPTDSNFRQIYLTILLISHINFSFPFLLFIFFNIVFFYITIKYIKKLVHLILLNQSKEMWAVLYVTYNVITSTILFNSIIDIFIFRCADLET